MTHTPLPRAISSATGDAQAKVAHQQSGSAGPDPRKRIWTDLLRALRFFNLNKGDLALLQALLWIPPRGGRLVFAKNDVLSTKAGKMSKRSISRHLGQLEAAGFITSNRSPNCKRFQRRNHERVLETYGFDLSPVFARAAEFATRAKEADDQDAALAVLQNRLSKLRARLESAGANTELVDELRRARRWALSPALPEMLAALERRALTALASIELSEAAEIVSSHERIEEPCPSSAEASALSVDKAAATPVHTGGLAPSGSHSGRHYQSRNDRVFSALTEREGPKDCPDEEQMNMGMGGGQGPLEGNPSGDVRSAQPDQEREAPALPDEPRLTVKDYVQSVLAGFQHKLRDETRPKLGTLAPRTEMTEFVHGGVSVTPAHAPRRQTYRHSKEVPRASGRGDLSEMPSLDAVLESCPEGLSLAGERPQTWSQLFEAAWRLGSWIGIPQGVLAKACARLGRDGMAVTLFGLCERLGTVREPAGYLLRLCARPGFHPAQLLRSSPAAPCAR